MRIDDPELVRREYATLDRFARRRIDVTGWLRFGDPDEFSALQAAIAEVRPQRVLDAGCGNGWITATIAAPDVIGVDQSQASVDATRARGIEARLGDIAELPFEAASFDVVMCNWTLYHLPDRDAGIAELARVLRPGGRFVGIYNFRDHLSELWSALGDPWSDQPDFDCAGGVDDLARWFTRVECRPTNGGALWETRDDLAAFLDAYVEFIGERKPPPGPYPFVATRHNCVLVEEKAN